MCAIEVTHANTSSQGRCGFALSHTSAMIPVVLVPHTPLSRWWSIRRCLAPRPGQKIPKAHNRLGDAVEKVLSANMSIDRGALRWRWTFAVAPILTVLLCLGVRIYPRSYTPPFIHTTTHVGLTHTSKNGISNLSHATPPHHTRWHCSLSRLSLSEFTQSQTGSEDCPFGCFRRQTAPFFYMPLAVSLAEFWHWSAGSPLSQAWGEDFFRA